MGTAAAIVLSFLVGSIPTGYLLARSRGIDLRKVGSGNIGATNTARALGWGWGGFTLAVDIVKGALPVLLLPGAVERFGGATDPEWTAVFCAAAAVAGHNWTPFLGFRGGKGVATGGGAMFALIPLPAACGLGVWLVVFALGRYVSLASVAAAVSLPFWVRLLGAGRPAWILTLVLAAVTVWKHRANLRRLARGEEPRVGKSRRGDERSKEENSDSRIG